MKKEEFVALGISEELAKKAADASADSPSFVPQHKEYEFSFLPS